MTSFEQQVRNALTIFDSHWRRTDKPELPNDVKEIIAVAMIDYAIQCELLYEKSKRQQEGKI